MFKNYVGAPSGWPRQWVSGTFFWRREWYSRLSSLGLVRFILVENPWWARIFGALWLAFLDNSCLWQAPKRPDDCAQDFPIKRKSILWLRGRTIKEVSSLPERCTCHTHGYDFDLWSTKIRKHTAESRRDQAQAPRCPLQWSCLTVLYFSWQWCVTWTEYLQLGELTWALVTAWFLVGVVM